DLSTPLAQLCRTEFGIVHSIPSAPTAKAGTENLRASPHENQYVALRRSRCARKLRRAPGRAPAPVTVDNRLCLPAPRSRALGFQNSNRRRVEPSETMRVSSAGEWFCRRNGLPNVRVNVRVRVPPQ